MLKRLEAITAANQWLNEGDGLDAAARLAWIAKGLGIIEGLNGKGSFITMEQVLARAKQALDSATANSFDEDAYRQQCLSAPFKTGSIMITDTSRQPIGVYVKTVPATILGGLAAFKYAKHSDGYGIAFAKPFSAGSNSLIMMGGFATLDDAKIALVRFNNEANTNAVYSPSKRVNAGEFNKLKRLHSIYARSRKAHGGYLDPLEGLEQFDSASGTHSDGLSIVAGGAQVAQLDSAASDADMVFYHGSQQADMTEIMGDSDKYFGGLFMSTDIETAKAHGQNLYVCQVPSVRVCSQHDLISTDPDRVIESLLENMPTLDRENEQQFIGAWQAVIEESASVVDPSLFVETGDQTAAFYEAQRVRGRVARDLGYSAVEMNDEHGRSYLVFAGNEITPSPQQTEPYALQWLDAAANDPASLLDTDSLAKFQNLAANEPRIHAEPAVAQRYAAVMDFLHAQGIANAQLDSAALAGGALAGEWVQFAEGYNSLKIPRVDMPQVKYEDHEALCAFLAEHGVTCESDSVPVQSLSPTQLEFSPAKVAKAQAYLSDNARPLLVSSCNHVLDGHHGYAARYDAGLNVDILRFSRPILDLLKIVKKFPLVTDMYGKPFEPKLIHATAPVA